MMRLAAMIVVANVIVWFLFVYNQSSDQLQHDQQELLLQGANAATGMPAIVNFAERKMLKRVFEIRDQAINTTTYIVDMNGHPHKNLRQHWLRISVVHPIHQSRAKSAEDRCAFPGRAERAVQLANVGGNLD